MTSTVESYIAASEATSDNTSPFAIEVRFLGGLTQTQQSAFKAAADRWTSLIVGDLPAVRVDGELIDDLLILAQGAEIDGVGKILGQAGPTHLRPGTAGASAFLPVKGQMTFDTADLANMEQIGTLNDVITHEMGHVLGIGTVWPRKGLVTGTEGTNPLFTGALAKKEYLALRGGPGPVDGVPVENTGGAGTRNSHWRESVFHNELMTGFVGAAGNPMSRMTAASLADLGYKIDMNRAEPYQLPSHLELAEQGALATDSGPFAEGEMLPIIPTELPEKSMP